MGPVDDSQHARVDDVFEFGRVNLGGWRYGRLRQAARLTSVARRPAVLGPQPFTGHVAAQRARAQLALSTDHSGPALETDTSCVSCRELVESANDSMERRRASRLPVNLPAVFHSSSVILDGVVADLSATGLRLVCPSARPPSGRVGDEASVAICCVAPTQVVVSGRVVWRAAQDQQAEMALEFAQLARSVRVTLANFILRSNQLRGPAT